MTIGPRSMRSPFDFLCRHPKFSLRVVAVLFFAAGMAFCSSAAAQTAYFGGAVSTLGGGFVNPYGVAVDASGNIFVADAVSDVVKEIPKGCADSSCVSTLGGGFAYPYGVAVDASGNVYVADAVSNVVKEIPKGCADSSCVKTLGSGFSQPHGVAVDGNGNVFVADTGTPAVKEILAAGGVIPTTPTILTLGGSFNSPTGVAVDGNGNVFVADTGNAMVKEILATGGYVNVNTLGSGFWSPRGVAVDGSGNVFVADGGQRMVFKIVAVGGNVSSASTVTTIGSGFGNPMGVSVDGSGNVFVADTINSGVKEIQLNGVNFGSVAVAATTPVTETLNFTFTGTLTIEAPVVLTQGAPGLDFTDAGASTCTATTYNVNDTCTVNVIFIPKYPGTRYGAVELLDGSGNALATAYIYGAGTGPQMNFLPGTQKTVADSSAPFGLYDAEWVAVDASGNVYIAEDHYDEVVKETFSGGIYTQSVIASGLAYPHGVAVDGAGNVYIADSNNFQVVEVPWTGTGYGAQVTLPNCSVTATGLAVDGSGNIYIADLGTNNVFKGSSGNCTENVVATGLSNPNGLAVDGNGNVYIANYGTNQVLEVPWTSSGYGAQTAIVSNLTYPQGLAVDGSGNLYLVDWANGGTVYKETLSGGSFTQCAIANAHAQGVAVDGGGNVYYTNSDGVLNMDFADAPSLNFATATNAGSPDSLDGALSVTLTNNGNAPLTAISPGVSVDANFMQVSGTGTPVDCTGSFSLAPGTSCNLSVEFAPVALANGSVSGSVFLTDNNLNASPSATQTIPMTGTAKQTPTITISNIPSNAVYGASFTPSIAYNGDGTVSLASNSPTQCTVEGSVVNFVGVGNCSLTASATAGTVYGAITGTVQTFAIAAVPLTITADNKAKNYGAALPSLTASYTGFVNGDTPFSLSTQPTLSTTATPASQVAGSPYAITASGAVDPNYSISYVAGSMTINAASLTITADNKVKAYGAALPTLTASYTGFVNGDTPFSLSTQPTLTTTATAASPVAGSPYGITAFGAVTSNYSITYVAGSMTINAVTASVTPTAAGKSYGASDPAFTGSLTGFLAGDSVTATYSRTPGETVAGGPYAISASLNPSGVLANYTITYNTTAFTINKATGTVTVGSLSQTYTGSALPATAITNPVGLTATFTYNGSATAPTAAGSYSVVGAISDANYTGTASGTLVISKAAATVTLGNLAQTYTGSQLSATAITNPNGLTVTFTYNGSATAPIAAGSYSVVGTISDANYTGTASGTLVISKAAATVTLGNLAQTYTGSQLSATTITDPVGLAVTFTYNGSATAPTAAGSYSVVGTINDANYTGTASGTLLISKAAATVALGSLAQTYTGSQLSATAITNPNGLTVTFTYNGSSNAPTAAGSYSVVGTISDANYTGTASGTLSINQATQVITFVQPGSPVTYGVSPIMLSATGGASGNSVIFSIVSGPGAITGNTLGITGAGTVLVAANQAGDSNYSSAAQVTRSIVVVAVNLSFNVRGLAFGSQPLGSTSSAQTLLITNPSGSPVTVTGIVVSGDFSAASNCPTIAALGTCSVNVTFTPTTTGTHTGTLTVADAQSNSPQTVSLTGTGTAPGIQVTPALLNYGSQVVSTTSNGQTITILNTGTASLNLSNIVTTGDFATTSNCATVPAGSNCSLTVTFTPQATGTRAGTVTFTDNAGSGDQSQSVNLSGIGTVAGATLTSSALTFPGTVVGAASFVLTSTLTNTGTAPLTGISVLALGDFTQTNACQATLNPGATCTINVQYAPTVAGTESGNLTVTDSLGMQSASLLGTGLAPGASLSTAQLVFGGQLVNTSSLAQTVVFTNTGSAPVNVTSVVPTNSFADTTNCSGSIAAGASCSINIVFTPTSAGSQSGTLTVTDSVGTQVFTAQGQGVSPGLAVTPSFKIFGTQVVGTSSQAQTLTATNTGTVSLTLNPIAVSSNFSESDQCPVPLRPGTSCSISLSFSPATTGVISGSLVVSDVSGLVSTLVTTSGQGTLPGITATPSMLSFGSLPVETTSQAQTVTVSNTGTAPMQIGAVTGTGDFAETDTCASKTIAAGSYCIINVTMIPSTMGTRTGAIQINDNADGAHMIALNGMGQQSGVSVYPTSLAFGSQPFVSVAQASLTAGTALSVMITNTGNLPLQLGGFSTQGDFTETDSCGVMVAVNGSCTLTLNFVPTALGHRTGTLTITDNAGGGSQMVSLEGDGSPVGLTLSPQVLNYGAQTVGIASQPQTALLTNHTGQSIANLAIVASGEYSETDTCGNALVNGSSCTLHITTTPVTTGAITGTITVFGTLGTGGNAQARAELSKIHKDAAGDGNSGNSSLGVIAVSASAIPPGISVSIPALSFSVTSVGTPSSGQTVMLQNTGDAASLTHLAISETNVSEFPFTTNCPATLAAQATCTMTINFAPTTYGLRAGTMNITADGGIAAALPESGTAVAAVNQLAFGTSPAPSVPLGGNAGSPITVLERNSNGNTAATATDTITLTVAGPMSYSSISTATAAAGVATFSLSTNTLTIAGGYTYTASVVSNASIKPAVAGETVSQAASAVSLTAGNNPSLLQNAVTFTATVGSMAGTPTGTVNFLDGATPLGSGLVSGGLATFTTSSLAVGSHNIAAEYIGDMNFLAASSGTLTQAVIDFSLSAGSAGGSGSSQTILPGSSATYSLSILPTAGTGLPGPVTLTVSGMPEGATAIVTPSSWTQLTSTSWLFPANTPLSGIALTVQLPSARASLDAKGLPGRKLPLILFGGLLLPFAGKMRRTGKKLSRMLSVLLLIAGMTAISSLSGCGSGTGFFAQQQKTYTMIVTATSATLSHSTTVTLTVE